MVDELQFCPPYSRAMDCEVVVERCDVAETRPLRQLVLRPHQRIDEMVMPGEDHPDGGFFVARLNGRIVTTGAILPSPGIPSINGAPDIEPRDHLWRIRGMATEPAYRGHGLGAMVLDTLLAHARGHAGSTVWASVRVPAVSFYTRAGFAAISEIYETESIGPHVQMSRGL